MVSVKKKASIKGGLGLRKQKTPTPSDAAELDRLVEEKIVSANNNNKWLKVKTALEETPKASNSNSKTADNGVIEYSSSDESHQSRDESALKRIDSHGSSSDESLARVGSSWDDEDQQENAFFEKSVKVETHQAVVKVLEHGNTQMLVLEVRSHVLLFFLIS